MHTEFVSLTHFLPWNGSPHNLPERSQAWTQSCKAMPGQRIASVEVLVAGPDSLPKTLLGANGDAVASIIGGGDAEVWSTFRLDENAATRLVLVNCNLNTYRVGRMVRRLLEIEVYRMLAAISHPLSQQVFSQAEAEMSRSAFADNFHRRTGLTPMNYVARWPLFRIRSEIMRSERSITAIAEENGWRSRTSCSRAFKDLFGVSPREAKLGSGSDGILISAQ